jgi:hypothetical protein
MIKTGKTALMIAIIALSVFCLLANSAIAAWTTEAVDAPGFFGDVSSRAIAIDSNGNPHITYGGDHLYYAYHDGSSWQYETVNGTGLSETTSIAIDSLDKVHISYYDTDNSELKYATNASGPWVTETVLAGIRGIITSIAIDSSDKVHISFIPLFNLMHATNKSGSWVTETVDRPGFVMYASIAIDSSDNVHISYCDLTNVDLKYATNASGSWEAVTVDSAGYVGLHTSIATDSSDSVYISYSDMANRNLKYATSRDVTPGTDSCASTGWDCEIVDSAGDVGEYTSIAIDSSDDVHISYYDSSNRDLRYATSRDVTPGTDSCGNTGWDCEIVDSAGDAGEYTSIAIDPSDNVHISYYDDSNYDLKYAANAPLDTDGDGDGIADGNDNCSATPNSGQQNSDSDVYGNICDCDLDNDGAVGFQDFMIFKAAWLSVSASPNWNADADFDSDGAVGFQDFMIFKGRWLTIAPWY